MSYQPGEIIFEEYHFETLIGQGALGGVNRVWDFKRNAPLAMKVLHSELVGGLSTCV